MSDPNSVPPTGGVINQPVSYEGKIIDPRDLKPVEPPLSLDEINALKGDVPPGTLGWVTLDEDGKPTGPATVEPPEPGVPAARVVIRRVPDFEEVLTPSGAPVTRNMNPSPFVAMDDAFLMRNPPDTQTQHVHSDNVDVAAENPEPHDPPNTPPAAPAP